MKKRLPLLLLVMLMLSIVVPVKAVDILENSGMNEIPEGYVDTSNVDMYQIISADENDEISMLSLSENAGKKVEIAFVIDTTGSMSGAISNVKSSVTEFAKYLEEQGVDLRMSVVKYRDITCDGKNSTIVHTINHSPWHTSTAQLVDTLSDLTVDGGGDTPETVIDALGCLVNESGTEDTTMRWSSDAYKFAFVLTDANYKTDNKWGYGDMSQIITALNANAISTSVITESSYYSVYRDLTELTGGELADIDSSDYVSSLKALADNVLSNTVKAKSIDICVSAGQTKVSEDNPKKTTTVFPSVEDATVILTYGDNRKYFKTDSTGVAHVDLTELSETEIKQARISAYKSWSIKVTDLLFDFYKNKTYMNDRWELQSMMTNEYDIPERYVYELHSEYLDENGNWCGEKLSDVVKKNGNISLKLPRLKLNMSVCYYEKTDLSESQKSANKEAVKNFMSKYSQGLAQSTDGQIMINKVLIGKTNDRSDFYLTGNSSDDIASAHLASMADIRIETSSEENKIRIRGSAHINGYFNNNVLTNKVDLKSKFSKKVPTDIENMSSNFYQFPRIHQSWTHFWHKENGIPSDISSDIWKTIVHETGHYVIGLYDEYLTGEEKNWSNPRPEGVPKNFGLMDSQWECLELSSYADYDYNHDSDSTKTAQLKNNDAPCKNTLSALLSDKAPTGTFGQYNAVSSMKYSKVTEGYKANYASAALSNDDFIEFDGTKRANESETFSIDLMGDGKGSSNELNVYNCEDGYYYISPNETIIGYLIPESVCNYTFTIDDTEKTYNSYKNVNEAIIVKTSKGVANRGEFYSVASVNSDIDYTTISWFKYDGTNWTKLDTDLSTEEDMNIGARCDYAGEGTYVLMAKPASTECIEKVENLKYTKDAYTDGIIHMTFNDSNDNTEYYNIYYSKSKFTDITDEDVFMQKRYAGAESYSIDFEERNKDGYVAVIAVDENGAKSPLSDVVKVNTGEADRDGDGIPDWYCDKYLLWPSSGEEKDIANSDDDNDGLTNLEEYKGGSDPTDPNDPVRTSNIAVQSVKLNKSNLNVKVGKTSTVTATITPNDASNKKVQWYSDDESIATVNAKDSNCTITGIAEGTTKITAVTLDGGYTASVTVTVSKASGKSSVTGGGGGSSVSTYTVKFDTNGGSKINSVKVNKNGTVAEPTAPTKDGFEFAGWYADKALTIKYDFDTKVTSGITLYAAWIESEITFTDVKDSDWFAENVKYVFNYGLMNGISRAEFAPNAKLTRAMLVTILYRAEGEPAVNKSIPFADVAADMYYTNAVIWAQQNGIISGVSENEFAPEEYITREQIVTIIYRYANYNGYDTHARADISAYTDHNEISEYAIEAMRYAVGSGLIKGKTETTLNPKDNATRAEIAAMLNRFIEGNK